jgi:hypothetical protein
VRASVSACASGGARWTAQPRGAPSTGRRLLAGYTLSCPAASKRGGALKTRGRPTQLVRPHQARAQAARRARDAYRASESSTRNLPAGFSSVVLCTTPWLRSFAVICPTRAFSTACRLLSMCASCVLGLLSSQRSVFVLRRAWEANASTCTVPRTRAGYAPPRHSAALARVFC